MKKVVLVVVLLFSLLFPSVVYADTGNACSPVMSDEKQKQITDFQDKDASLQESYAIDIIQMLLNSVNINTINTLVFGNPYCLWLDDDVDKELVFGIFTQEQKEKIVDPIFHLFTGLFSIVLLISMMLTGLRMGLKPLGSKVEFSEEFTMYLTVVVVMICYWIGIEYVLNLNTAITGSFKDLLLAQGIDLNSSAVVSTQDDFNFTDIIIVLAEWVLMLFLNFVYILRSFMVMILLGLGGLAILSLLFQSTRSYFGTWIQDLLGAVFMQSIHSLYLTVVLLFATQLSGEMSVLIKLFLLIMFLPLSSTILNWLNLSSGDLATSVGMTGINSIAGAIAMSQKLKNTRGIPKHNDLSSLKTTKISAGATGINSKSWQSAKSVTKKLGMGVGAAAGSVLGPGGVAIGGTLGSMGTTALLQGSRNVAGGIKGAANTINGIKSDGFKNVMGDLQKRRQAFGDIGESMGAIVGAGGPGRSIGNGLSGVSRQRLANSTESGGLSGATLSGLATQHPGAAVTFMQNNQGSGFYMNDQLISPMGAADTNLSNGEMRKVDYQFSGMTPTNSGDYAMTSGGDGSLVRNTDAYIQSSDGGKYNDPGFKASSIVPDDYYRSGMNGANQASLSDRVADKVGRHPGFV